MINDNSDLIELQNYLKDKYNINVYLDRPKIINRIEKIEQVYFYLFFLIFFISILFILYFKFKKYINKIINYNLFTKIIYYFLLIYIIVYSLFYLQKYLSMIYFYNKDDKLFENNNVKFNKSDFHTGDILQELTNWNYKHGLILKFLQLEFLHNVFIIEFKNKHYILHYNINYGYPQNILYFQTKYLEICLLDDYLKDNYSSTKYYRVLKKKTPINNDIIFNFLKTLNIPDSKFSFLPCIKNCKYDIYSEKKYNCMNFILRLLYYSKIIPEFNFYNFTSNDLEYLPSLSNNLYNEPFIVKI